MNDQIICPNCKKVIPLTEALSHQIQEKYQKFYKQRLAEEVGKRETAMRGELEKKIKIEMDLQLKNKSNEAEELRQQNKSLQEQFLELNRLIRQLRDEKEKQNREMERKITESQEKIKQNERKRSEEENKFKFLEYEKRLQDVSKANEDLRRKLEQGSQQTQGEILELELEQSLKRSFPYDEIKPVPKGVTGADIIQTVKNESGKTCGTIIWESKRTKAWSDGWISKLKEDQRQVKAEVAVIISQTVPGTIKHFGMINDVWIGDYESITGLAIALRNSLISIASVKLSSIGKQEKKEVLWNYLTGTEFKQRIEAMYDAYSQLQSDVEQEKRYFAKKWAREEKNIRMVIDNMLGMHGDLQGIVGKALPGMKEIDELPAKTGGTLF